jgi:hypothetical protein
LLAELQKKKGLFHRYTVRNLDRKEIDKFTIDESYTGPSIHLPITFESMLELIEYFKQGKTLHYRFGT